MPISRSNILGAPNRKIGSGWLKTGIKPFRSQPFSTYNASITGVTRDSSSVALGNCVVQLFRTLDDLSLGETVSDGSGNYQIFPVPNVGGPYYIVAYKAGSPDVAGTTVNTLTTA